MHEKKVLIITYYWPPSGGSGVQRWLKFVKYLPQFGWEPIVFTPESPSFGIKDPSLLKDVPAEAEVIHFPIWEPYNVFNKLSHFTGHSTNEKHQPHSSGKKSLFTRISVWIRGNIFIPDPRVFWVKPSVSFLGDFIRDNNIRTIITTGPPHSVHLIGYHLKKKNNTVSWLADFRDPWTEWGLLDTLQVGTLARWVHQRLERKVLLKADGIITITPFYQERFKVLSGRAVHLLTNGYDEDDFKELVYKRPDKFTLRHVGIVNEKCNPRPLMEAMKQWVQENPEVSNEIVVEFIGAVHDDFRAFINNDLVLRSITSFSGNIPHKQLITLYGESSMLLLILAGYKDAEGFMPGKLFEYLATGLPILGIGPVQGDASKLLQNSGAGEMVDEHDRAKIKLILVDQFRKWKDNVTRVNQYAGAVQYSRREITGRLASLLNKFR